MIVTAWNNSKSSYGIKITMLDREQFFQRNWKTVIVQLEGSNVQAEVNVGKASFWSPACGELINREIRTWLKENGLDSWPSGNPPRLSLEPLSNRRFLLRKSALSETYPRKQKGR